MLALMRDIRPHGFIFGGDQFDNAEISHHNSAKPIYKERGSYKQNVDRFDQDILKPIESVMRPGEMLWIKGNHTMTGNANSSRSIPSWRVGWKDRQPYTWRSGAGKLFHLATLNASVS
jgi:hypothetical protein